MSRHFQFLFISYYFPPVKVVGALRLYHIYRELSKTLPAPWVLSSSNRRRFAQEPTLELHPERLIELPTWDLRRATLRRKSGNPAHLSRQYKTNHWVRRLRKLSDSFPFNLLWGDGGLVYILEGYRRGVQLVEQEGITHLFSSFRPYSDHAVAYLLKRRFPQLVWVADFRDLHVNRALDNVYWPERQHRFNRRILQRADVVTTVSQGLARSLQQYHPNVYLLPNGIGDLPADLPTLDLPPKFTIGYTGSVYPRLQDARFLLSPLQRLIREDRIDRNKIQLAVAGKDGATWRQWLREFQLDDLLLDLGLISRPEALALQQHSHLNLLLSWSLGADQGILTAKLYEYLAARRPILGMVKGNPDPELEAIFDRLVHSSLFYTGDLNAGTIDSFLLEHYRNWERQGQPLFSIEKRDLKAFSWETHMDAFIAFLNSRKGPSEQHNL